MSNETFWVWLSIGVSLLSIGWMVRTVRLAMTRQREEREQDDHDDRP